jgi:hypothetical protein
MTGTRRDGTAHQMAGVILFGVRDGRFWARFYLEPVQAGARTSTRPCASTGRCRARARLPTVIVVAGGTGALGARLVPRLTDQGLAVRVLTRDPVRAQHVAGPSVELVQGMSARPYGVAAARVVRGGWATSGHPRAATMPGTPPEPC